MCHHFRKASIIQGNCFSSIAFIPILYQQKTYTIRDPKSKLYWAADKTNHISLQIADAKWILTTAPGGFTISPSNNPDLYVTYKGNGNLLTLEGNISQLNQEWIFVPSKASEHAIQLVQHSNQFAFIGNNGFIIASTNQLGWIFEEK
ncbi:hypothetical protein C1646_771443 [Rhizophagus diaphanus]|nr:hypothetical protein C1646_771443 [Rhizophagus diaphanus] [Rhizophagus sp. MUCL 43196]